MTKENQSAGAGERFRAWMVDERWTWEELFTALSKERSLGQALEVPVQAMTLPVEEVGRPFIRFGHESLRAVDDGSPPTGDITFRVDISDGSHLLVDVIHDHYRLTLIPAPLPMVGWLPKLAPLPWLTLPSALVLLALSILI